LFSTFIFKVNEQTRAFQIQIRARKDLKKKKTFWKTSKFLGLPVKGNPNVMG